MFCAVKRFKEKEEGRWPREESQRTSKRYVGNGKPVLRDWQSG